MITIRPATARGAARILLLCILHPSRAPASEPHTAETLHARGGPALARDLTFAHVTTADGLSRDTVLDILQDRRGFMWFATGEGLDRYDGNALVVFKHNPDDPGSLSHNFIRDVLEDDEGYLWVAAYPGVNRFDPVTERAKRYVHDPGNRNGIAGDLVESIARDSHGQLWFGTAENGLDRFDPATETFTHYHDDVDGRFVGRITRVIEDSRREIWFVGARGLFHLDPHTGRITRPPGTADGLGADDVCEDDVGNLWMLAHSPIVGLVKYDRRAERLTQYPLGTRAAGVSGSRLLADGSDGLWVPSSLGLHYFDRRTERLTRLFQRDDSNPRSLNDDTVISIYRDRAGLLWVGTEKGGINILDFRQEQFGPSRHRAGDRNSLSARTATAIHEGRDGVLWIGYFPRALDRWDRRTGTITHYLPDPKDGGALGRGDDIKSIYEDARGRVWLGGWAGGLDRLDLRTGRFKHYRNAAGDPQSLMSDNVVSIYEDRRGRLWVGHFGGVSIFGPATERFTNYRLDPSGVASLAYCVSAMCEDRGGTLWLGTWGGVLSRFDEKTRTFVNNPPDLRNPLRLQGGNINAIHEDRAGTLWLATGTGLYGYDRQSERFTRYTERQGLPTNDVMGILEDRAGRLWVSTTKGISRFDPRTATFRNYDASDGLQGDIFSAGCHSRGRSGEMFFCGSDGINAFFPEAVRDDPHVPPVVITSFKISNKPVPIGANSVLQKAIPYVDSLTLSHRDSVFSFEFAALSYASPQKNRYRYRLESFEPDWNEVGSRQRLATYTNLDPGKYVFRVQGSNADGIWNEEGVALPISITPPWWSTRLFRAFCIGLFLALLWALYQARMLQVRHAFETRLDARVGERTRIARELHDTLLQSFHGLLLRFQTAAHLLPDRPREAKQTLEDAIQHAAKAITEGRDAVQGLRASTVECNDLALAVRTLGDELGTDASIGRPPTFRVTVEGQPHDLHPIVRDEVYKIAAEALRNAFRHARAGQVEVEMRYDPREFRLRVRDDGKGIDPMVLASQGMEGHYGLRGMPERAALIGGKLAVWSEPDAGTEVELRLPATAIYATSGRRSRLSRLFASRTSTRGRGDMP